MNIQLHIKFLLLCSIVTISLDATKTKTNSATGAITTASKSNGTLTITTSGGKYGGSRTVTNSQATGHQATATTSQGNSIVTNGTMHTVTNATGTENKTVQSDPAVQHKLSDKDPVKKVAEIGVGIMVGDM